MPSEVFTGFCQVVAECQRAAPRYSRKEAGAWEPSSGKYRAQGSAVVRAHFVWHSPVWFLVLAHAFELHENERGG